MDVESIKLAVTEASEAGRLSCAGALGLARKLDRGAAEVGAAANSTDVRIVDCQLGCFTDAKATHEDLADYRPPAAIANEITASVEDGSLPCPAAFEVSRKFKVKPRQIGDAATTLGIKISHCQLGCFP